MAPAIDKIIRLYLSNKGPFEYWTERDYISLLTSDDFDESNPFLRSGYRELPPDYVGSTYSTGTLTGSINTKNITGSGTAFEDNLQVGSIMTIGGYDYNVDSITDDTHLVLAQKLVAAATGATYSAESVNRKKIKFI